jgi:hypothetical protein
VEGLAEAVEVVDGAAFDVLDIAIRLRICWLRFKEFGVEIVTSMIC